MLSKGDILGKSFKVRVVETFAALITSAFGLVAALAWNETIKTAVGLFFDAEDGIWGLLVYAIIVTFIAIFATILIAWQADRIKGDDE